MVRGLSKRVVVLKSPDKRLFEEAIFIVREEAAAGVCAQDIVAQARAVAAEYAAAAHRRLPRAALYALTALAAFALGVFFGVFAGVWL